MQRLLADVDNHFDSFNAREITLISKKLIDKEYSVLDCKAAVPR